MIDYPKISDLLKYMNDVAIVYHLNLNVYHQNEVILFTFSPTASSLCTGLFTDKLIIQFNTRDSLKPLRIICKRFVIKLRTQI